MNKQWFKENSYQFSCLIAGIYFIVASVASNNNTAYSVLGCMWFILAATPGMHEKRKNKNKSKAKSNK